jgi:hypothetical protein
MPLIQRPLFPQVSAMSTRTMPGTSSRYADTASGPSFNRIQPSFTPSPSGPTSSLPSVGRRTASVSLTWTNSGVPLVAKRSLPSARVTGNGGGVAFRGLVNEQSNAPADLALGGAAVGDAAVDVPRAAEPHAAMTRTTGPRPSDQHQPPTRRIRVVPRVSRWYD